MFFNSLAYLPDKSKVNLNIKSLHYIYNSLHFNNI